MSTGEHSIRDSATVRNSQQNSAVVFRPVLFRYSAGGAAEFATVRAELRKRCPRDCLSLPGTQRVRRPETRTKQKDCGVIHWLERRFGRFAVPNVTAVLIVGQVMAWIAEQINPGAVVNIVLIPGRVLNGEVYRLVSFLFLPPGTNLLFAFFYWYLFYLMGTALEMYWGAFRYNLFLLIGYVATVATGFILPGSVVTNHFVEGTVFLAFAFLNPTFELRLFFILPVQIRWLALLAWIGYGAMFVFGSWPVRLQVAASLLNFFVFFGRDILVRMRDGRRVMARQAKRFAAARAEPDYFHICAVCGITDKTHPDMDFRYCSRCSGNRAYCTEHLRNHEHVRDDQDD